MMQKRGATGSVTPRFFGSNDVKTGCLASRAIPAFYTFSLGQRSANVKGTKALRAQVC